MSGELSNVQKNTLAGKIAEKLYTYNGNAADNKISVSVWNEFWGKSAYKDSSARSKEANELETLTQGQDGDEKTITLAQAFDLIMKRIFTAAKKGFSGTWEDATDPTKVSDEGAQKVNEVAQKILAEASGDASDAVSDDDDGRGAHERPTVSNETKWSLNQLSADDRAALNGTSVGQIVLNLDALDGQTDGFINKDVWNDFVQNKIRISPDGSNAHKIQNRITLKDALRSIKSYANSAARKANAEAQDGAEQKTADSIAQEWSALYTEDKAFKHMKIDGLSIAPVVVAVNEKNGEEPVEDSPTLKSVTAQILEADTDFGIADTAFMTLQDAQKALENAETQEAAQEQINTIKSNINKVKEQIQAANTKIEAVQEEFEKLEADDNNKEYTDAQSNLKNLSNLMKILLDKINALEDVLPELEENVQKLPTEKKLNKQRVDKATTNSMATLKENKAKTKQRIINGIEQTYYRYKDKSGNTVRVIINTETGELDNLIQIKGGGVNKHFITVSQLKKATNNDKITELPPGITCEYKIVNDKPVLTFKDKDGIEIEASKIPNYPASMIDDSFKEQLKNINTGVTNLPEFAIEEDGSFNMPANYANFVNTYNSYFSNIQHTITQGEDEYRHRGPIKVKAKSNRNADIETADRRLNNKYNTYVQYLSIRGEKYKQLSQKTEALIAGEQAFMRQYEIDAYNFIHS